MKKVKIRLIKFLLVIFLFSCVKYYENNKPPVSISAVTIIVSSPGMTLADNSSSLTITATVKDKKHHPLSGQSVTLSCSGTGFSLTPAGSQNSNFAGQAVWALTSSTEGVRTITAVISGTSLNDSIRVYFYDTIGGLSQPNGTLIPSETGCDSGQPTGLAVILASQCVDEGITNIGVPCFPPDCLCDDGLNSTCETTLWHECNDNTCIPSHISGLNPRDSALIKPDTFKPAGIITFKALSLDEAMFNNAFGWYNATGAKPDSDDLHVVLDCNSSDGNTVIVDVLNDPSYMGGMIGFFIVTPESLSSAGTCEGGNCCASIERFNSGAGYVYYSERNYNPDWIGESSVIHLLIYASHVWENKFYFAWEDMYGTNNINFSDFVVSVTGIGF